MFNHKHYVPILKWKMGEYQALQKLTPAVKAGVTPLLEIPPVGFDFETGQPRNSPDDHLADFGKRLKSKWPTACFVDLKYMPVDTRLSGGVHYIDAVFGAARTEGCLAIPVVGLNSDQAFISSTSSVVAADQRGVCLRVLPSDFDRPTFTEDIETRLRALGVGWGDTDLIIDLVTDNYPMRAIEALLGLVPMINRWRTLTIAGTSYPQSVAAINPPFERIPRHEWATYQALIASLPPETRIPTFGDYGVAHPDLVELDMRLIKPFAKLRYTTDDSWHIGRGTPVRTNGFGQYQQMCADLVRQRYFNGTGFSAADTYIADCAIGNASTGNLSTWVWVATNRHLSKVVSDLASLYGL